MVIIINAFSEMRTQADSIREDTEARCFICNINRDEFGKFRLI